MIPEHLERHPTKAGRESLAARLDLTIGPYSQDWEWEVAEPQHFQQWLSVYRDGGLSDDERFSLMEMLVQCIEDMASDGSSEKPVEQLPEWHVVASLLRADPRLHASTIAYWSVLDEADPEAQFRVSVAMRRVWADAQASLQIPGAPVDGREPDAELP